VIHQGQKVEPVFKGIQEAEYPEPVDEAACNGDIQGY